MKFLKFTFTLFILLTAYSAQATFVSCGDASCASSEFCNTCATDCGPCLSTPGNTCADPYVLTLPHTSTQTTCDRGKHYSSTNYNCGGTSSYWNGEDMIFSYTPSQDTIFNMTLGNTSTWTGMAILDGCPGTGACIAYNEQSGGNPAITNVAVTGGITYYIIVSTYPSPYCTNFDVNAWESDPSSCSGDGTNNCPCDASFINACGSSFTADNIGHTAVCECGTYAQDLDCNASTGDASGNEITNYSVESTTYFQFCPGVTGTWSVTMDVLTCSTNDGMQYAVLQGSPSNMHTVLLQGAGGKDGDIHAGNSVSFTFDVTDISAGCVFVMFDGYAGNECTFNVTVDYIGEGCILLNPTCTQDSVYITSTTTTNANTFTVEFSGPIKCDSIDATDFDLDCSSSTTDCSTYSITGASGVGCVANASGDDTTRVVQITLDQNLPAGYLDDWLAVLSGTSDIEDTCSIVIDSALAGGAIILPVELMYFNVERVDDEVRLNWATASEKNSSHFVIERSTKEGNLFIPIGEVTAAGNSIETREYTFTDKNPANDINYYRLKVVDRSGMEEYTGIRSADMRGAAAGFAIRSIKPVPAKEWVYVDLASGSKGKVNVRVYDLTGRTVTEKTVEVKIGSNEIPIYLDGIDGGMYFVSIEKDGKAVQSKFVKY